MCLGVPMQIVSVDEHVAVCQSDDRRETVDLALTGPQPVGTWVLVFLGAAREVLDPESAEQITRALAGLRDIMSGGDLGNAFHDLESREPTLPPHLEAARQSGAKIA